MNVELPRKKLDLSSAIAEGDIRVLLMVLVHMTGDEKWLEPPYKPKRDVRLIPDPDAGVGSSSGLGGGAVASASSAARRTAAVSRLRHCERCSEDRTVTTPSTSRPASWRPASVGGIGG